MRPVVLAGGPTRRRTAPDEVLQPLADEWHEIPAGTFRKEGTDVPTFLFLITK